MEGAKNETPLTVDEVAALSGSNNKHKKIVTKKK